MHKMIRVEHDRDADSVYVHVARKRIPVAKTLEAAPGLELDFDEEGLVVGVKVSGLKARSPDGLRAKRRATQQDYDDAEAIEQLIQLDRKLNKEIYAQLMKPQPSPWSAVAVSAAIACVFVSAFAYACYQAVH